MPRLRSEDRVAIVTAALSMTGVFVAGRGLRYGTRFLFIGLTGTSVPG
jgi:hypothetical protein